jgi:16S rRNA (cytidine1402-2'-O)-methyltransferase
MLSGLPGQRFSFRGYLKSDEQGRNAELKHIESLSKKEKSTQIFIEAPYRNNYMLKSLMEVLSDDTKVCIAWDLTMPDQGLLCEPVSRLKKMPLPNLEKKPAIFLLYSE